MLYINLLIVDETFGFIKRSRSNIEMNKTVCDLLIKFMIILLKKGNIIAE